jgi:hypothetical protein
VFHNLTINNAAGIDLTVNATVNGVLAFASGNLNTGMGSNQLTLGSGSTVTSAGGDVVRNSFVTGTTYAFNNPNTSINVDNVGTLPSNVAINF